MGPLQQTIFATVLVGLLGCNIRAENKSLNKQSVAHGQASRLTTEQIFPENSIGVAYLDTVIANRYSLTIRFPNSSIPDSIQQRDTSDYTRDIPINVAAQLIILFDEGGEIITLTNVKNCISKFWCENDGGTQYEPTYKLTIEEKNFKRIPKLQDRKKLGKISCFAIANYNPSHFKSFYPANGEEKDNVLVRGRLSTNNGAYANDLKDIYKYYDRNAQITIGDDDSGIAEYCVLLQAFNSRQEFELGCCGP